MSVARARARAGRGSRRSRGRAAPPQSLPPGAHPAVERGVGVARGEDPEGRPAGGPSRRTPPSPKKGRGPRDRSSSGAARGLRDPVLPQLARGLRRLGPPARPAAPPPFSPRARGGVTPRPRRDVDDGGGWRVAVRTQKTRSDVALRHFSDEKLVMSLGQLLERYNEVRVNSSDAPKSLFSDCWTPWNDRDAEACYVELRRRLAASSPGRSPSPGDTISVADNERVLCCVLECGGDYAGAPSSLPRPRRLFFVLFRRRASLGLFYVGGARASGRRTRAAARTRTCRSGSSWRPSTT